jgi:hypothetical protein
MALFYRNNDVSSISFSFRTTTRHTGDKHPREKPAATLETSET